MNRNYWILFFTAWIVLVSGTIQANAQAVSIGQINGRVTDGSGAVIPRAKVQATQLDTHTVHDAEAGDQGEFVFNSLPIGSYELSISAPGFKEYRRPRIDLHVGDNTQINATLSVGEVNEVVTVYTATSTVDTTDNTIRQVIGQAPIVDLPLNGRQPTQLVLLSGASITVPSTATGDINTSKNFYSSTTISVAGGQANGTNYILDGGDNNDPMTNVNLPFPFPEALQEFSVDTSTLPAQYGLHPGGVVNIVTRSGSNSFHGDAFEYIRNYAVNARNYFATTTDSLKRNQFGGDIGGHIVRDKLFFFTGYQGTRNQQSPTSISYVPTPAILQGNFSTFESASCVASGSRTLINPSTGQPFSPANQIPTSSFSPQAVALTKYLPQTSDPCGKVLYSIPTTGNEDQILGRIDSVISSKQSLFGRYFFDDYRNPGVFQNNNLLLTTRAGNLELAQSFTLGHTYAFTPNTVNSLHLTITRLRNNRGPASNVINPGALGVNSYDYLPNNLQVTVGSLFSVGCGSCSPAHINRDELQVADDVNLVHGPHSFVFGVDVIRARLNSLTPSDANGNFTFNGTFTSDAMADFLLGNLSNYDQSAPLATNYRGTFYGFYGQDTYRVTHKLTINAGLRWEPYTPATNTNGLGADFSMSAYTANQISSVYVNAPPGVSYYGDRGVSKSLTHNYWPNFSPRIGVIYVPGAEAHDTFRAGFAILTDTPELYFAQHSVSSPPFADSIYLTAPAGGFANPWGGYAGGNPFPIAFPPSKTAPFPTFGQYVAYPPDVLIPTHVAEWNVSYEHQFPDGFLLKATYLGNSTTHILGSDELNPAQYIPGMCGATACSTTANTNQRRILNTMNPNAANKFGDVEELSSEGNASYNAFLVTAERRLANGFTLLTNYTYSHCLSDLDFSGDPYQPIYEQPFNRAADYGSCSFDVRHLFNTSIVARSPEVGSKFTRLLLGNWQMAPLIRYQSGLPVNILTGTDRSLSGQNLDRPNQVLSDIYTVNRGPRSWVNPAAFTPNALGTFGNLSRNAARGPGYFEFDAAVDRLFPIHETLNGELRLDVFNVLNWVNFGNPNGTLSSSNFGKITTANDPRILQLAVKLHF